MSYWPELLIETYHLLIEEATILYRTINNLAAVLPANQIPVLTGPKAVADRMVKQASAIKKRMKSLGYYDCWGDKDETKAIVP